MACPALGDDLSDLFPILEPGGSDSACFDNCMELLVRAGRSAPHAADDDDSRGLRAELSHLDGQAGVLRVSRGDHGAVGRPGGHGLHRRPAGGRHAGPQRPAAQPLRGDHRRPGGAGQRGGRDRVPARADRAKGPLQPGRMFLVDTEEGRIVDDNEIKGKIARQQALSPLAGGEPHRAAGPVPARQADGDRPRHAGRSGCGPSATPAKNC